MTHKYFDFSKLGGFPLNQQRLDYMQQSYTESIQAISTLIGDRVIISGCEINGTNVTNGWVIVGGELLPFIGGTNVLQSTFLVRTTPTALRFKDNTQKEVQFYKFCSFGVGAGAINWDSLTRLKTIQQAQQDISGLNTTTQILTDRIITGTFIVNVSTAGEVVGQMLSKEIEGFDASKYVGFLSNITATLGSTYDYIPDAPVGTLRFWFKANTPHIGVPMDYVLIKKQ